MNLCFCYSSVTSISKQGLNYENFKKKIHLFPRFSRSFSFNSSARIPGIAEPTRKETLTSHDQETRRACTRHQWQKKVLYFCFAFSFFLFWLCFLFYLSIHIYWLSLTATSAKQSTNKCHWLYYQKIHQTKNLIAADQTSFKKKKKKLSSRQNPILKTPPKKHKLKPQYENIKYGEWSMINDHQ